MGRFVDRSGQKHFMLTFIKDTKKRHKSGGAVIWLLQCDCGNLFESIATAVTSGHTKSCGCLSTANKSKVCIERNTTHGLTRKTKLYGVWVGMRRRCKDIKSKSFIHYGARGISVCEEWNSYEQFHKWALCNGYAHGLEIDRINNDGNYEPGNCRFITRQENCKNKRKVYTRRSE